ncbi:MAG: cytochrome c oxidase accessory protein CcoG [Proteobacteria bacterium]|nr:MAG: cytochrome c oxidase accessory protein CcoG [Pseudomonadota bacterium]
MSKSRVDTQQGDIESQLYAKRQKIYPREVHGIFAWFRTAAVLVLLGLYYVVPWLRWDGRQAILFDLPDRKFYLFGLTIWPQDFIYLSALLIIAAMSLFFFTALAGRLWCGYACPQTVWTEVFLWIERKIEGSRQKQIKRDKAPLDAAKFGVKAAKHAIWIGLSLWTGFTFVGYFTPILELGEKIVSFETGPWETFWVLFYGFATYGNAGWLREQVCIYMCPYARFQSAMVDSNTLIISYDPARGEPRGPRRKGVDPGEKGLGHCIDCSICVQVCPVGIDIRDGLQYQCIGCAACIDACDDVMAKMNYPKGLIRYTTQTALHGGDTRIMRPRVFVYLAILLTVLGSVFYGLFTRDLIGLDVIRDRNALYRETGDGLIENVYTLKILNMHERAHEFDVDIAGLSGARLIEDDEYVIVDSGRVVNYVVRVQVAPDDLERQSNNFEFRIESQGQHRLAASEAASFVGPRWIGDDR